MQIVKMIHKQWDTFFWVLRNVLKDTIFLLYFIVRDSKTFRLCNKKWILPGILTQNCQGRSSWLWWWKWNMWNAAGQYFTVKRSIYCTLIVGCHHKSAVPSVRDLLIKRWFNNPALYCPCHVDISGPKSCRRTSCNRSGVFALDEWTQESNKGFRCHHCIRKWWTYFQSMTVCIF